MSKRLTRQESARLQKVAKVYNLRKHVLYSLQWHYQDYREMLKRHEIEKDMFLAGIRPWEYEGVAVPGGDRTYKVRGRKYKEDSRTAIDPGTGKKIHMPTREPGSRVGVPPRIAEALLALIELGEGHLGTCPPPCGKTFVKQRSTTRFCSPGCRDKARLSKPSGLEDRRNYMKEYMRKRRAEEKEEQEHLRKRGIRTGHRASK